MQQIAIGIILNSKSQVFVAIRPEHTKFGGMQEFPGGKVELNEHPEEALKRELQEEVGIEVLNYVLFHIEAKEDLSQKTAGVELFFYLVFGWSGEPFGKETQKVEWRDAANLDDKEFPPMNGTVISKLKDFISNL